MAENLIAAAPDLQALLDAYDAIQQERDGSETRLEELELSTSYGAAEERQDLIDDWTGREAYVAGRLIHLLRQAR